MKRTAFILLLMFVSLLIEPLSPWELRDRPTRAAQSVVETGASQSRPYQSLTIATTGGSFVLNDLRLVRTGASTKLEGKLINRTGQRWDKIVFALKAYDSNGRQLTGVESETIFGFHQVGKGKSVPINSGYGVWLEGIPLSAVARVEVFLLDDDVHAEQARAHALTIDTEE